MEPKTGLHSVAFNGVNAVVGTRLTDEDIAGNFAFFHDTMRQRWTESGEAAARRRADNDRCNKSRNKKALIPELAIGDLVLVARQADKDKLKMIWQGPCQITAVPSVCKATVVPFTTIPGRHRPRNVHITRIRRFSAQLLGAAADFHVMTDLDFPDNEMHKFTGHVVDDDTGDLWLGVRWCKCDPDHDSRLPVSQLVEDAPNLVHTCLLDNAADFPACAAALTKFFP